MGVGLAVLVVGGFTFVLIPYSSGMGVGPETFIRKQMMVRLNTLFVRYGCGTGQRRLRAQHVPVLIPYSSGMGVGLDAFLTALDPAVLIPYSSGMGVGPQTVSRICAIVRS